MSDTSTAVPQSSTAQSSTTQSSTAQSAAAQESKASAPPVKPTPGEMVRAGAFAFLAWMLPGAAHLVLGRRARAAAFCALVMLSVLVGILLAGRLPWIWSGSPLAVLATLGCQGSGLPALVAHHLFSYAGDVQAVGYEYGSAFILSAGLMNLLLALDAWDIALGRKS